MLVHLHVHTHFSFGAGVTSPARLVDPVTPILVSLLVVVLAVLMVSRLRYRSFKEIDLRKKP